MALFLGGAVAPFVLVCLWLLLAGTLGTFLFWSFVYGSTYSASLSASVGNLGGRFVAVAPSSSVTLTLVVIGLGALLRDSLRSRKIFVLLLAAASCVGFAVGLHFRPQYCLLLIPALAVTAAVGLDALGRLMAERPHGLRQAVAVILVIAAVAQPLYASRDVLFELGPTQVARAIYRDPVLSRYGIQAVPPIHIIVDNGHVTLEGVVNTEMEKNVAGIRASGAGLSFGQVTNNLQVERPNKKG